MPFILNIETATQLCSVGVSDAGKMLSVKETSEKNIHASKVTVFAQEVCHEAKISMKDLAAVAVSKGPGSYTGLRIGVSAAKGFCYALDIPLLAVPTLQCLALGARKLLEENAILDENTIFSPMIDARRMEVYTALYDQDSNELKNTEALIVDEHSFNEELLKNKIYYFGDGAEKCREILDPKGMIYLEGVQPSATSLAEIAARKFKSREFENLAYFEPFYLKDFIAGKPRVKGLE